MAKRIKCEIGNVVMIPVAKDLYGIARVINKVEDTCLLELYITKPFKSSELIKLKEILKCKKVITWGYGDAIKRGEWKIIENIEPTEDIEMPYFRSAENCSVDEIRYYLQKGDFDNPLRLIGERIYVSLDEIRKYMRNGITSSGICFSGAVEKVFRLQMQYNNFLSEDAPSIPDITLNKRETKKAEFEPFIFFRNDNGIYTITLEADGEYRQQIFDEFKDDGWLGNGTDWESLAMYYLENNMNEALEQIEFDSEAGMFAAYSKKCRIFKKFLKGFKEACENDEIMREMLKNTEPM